MPESGVARYARQIVLPGFGPAAQQKLRDSRVLVIGAGGLGSAVIPSLAAGGVGTIGIVDNDIVETSNLARQLIHFPDDVGRAKVTSALETIGRLNPETNVVGHNLRLSAGNALALFQDYDLVLDGSDNFPTRYLIDDAASLTDIPSVWGAVSQFGGQSGVSWATHGPTYRDLFPDPPPPGSVPSCEEGGVLPSVCAVIGAIMSTETLKLITGIGDPLLGRVTTYDARSGAFRQLDFARNPAVPPVTELIDYELFCGVSPDDKHNTDEGDRPMAANEDLTAEELAAVIEAKTPIQLVDVREDWESEIARIPGATLIPLGELPDRAGELDPEATTVVYCHAGVRSAKGRDILRSLDFTDVRSLSGGIDAWSRDVDPDVARY